MKNSAFIKLATEQDSAYVDIFDTYGVSFFKGSYLKLINTSRGKSYVTNESRLTNGTQYLASATYAKRSERSVSLDILMEASSKADFVTKYEAFTNKIANGGLFWLKIPSYARIFKLVYSDIQPKQEYRNNRATFTLSLIEPNPLDRVTVV